MQDFLIEETPGKVLGFTVSALFSLALLLGVSATNASFKGVEYVLPDPFAPLNVMSGIDQVAAAYSKTLLSFTEPARVAVAEHVESMVWVMNEAALPLVKTLGLQDLVSPKAEAVPQVAGAFKAVGDSGALSVDTLYAILFGR